MGNSTLLKRLSEAQYVSLILFATLILNLNLENIKTLSLKNIIILICSSLTRKKSQVQIL